MNILILSVGTRNKIIQEFKKSTKGKVVVTDMSHYAPALYEADVHYLVPRIDDINYIETILEICKKEEINAVLSLIDPELELLAENKELFEENGVKVIGSSLVLCKRALNKMEMYKWLRDHNYKCAKSYDSLEGFYQDYEKGLISFPVFVKPICGSASISINKVESREELLAAFQMSTNLMIQEFLKGKEIGADCYIDTISGQVVSIFTKEKILMRAGETDKARSFIDEELFVLIKSFIEDSGWRGQIDIDIFEVNGEYYISEVNPRFGGGYPMAYECGCDHMKLIENNVNGKENAINIGYYEENVVLMKYNEIKTIKEKKNK